MNERRFRVPALVLAMLSFALPATPPAGADGTLKPRSLAVREAAFLRTVDPQNTANVVTGDLIRFTGTHIAYVCEVDSVVRPGLILGQCGSSDEPMDLFVHLPTAGLHIGSRVQVLGVIEPPAQWTDLTGHTVYYAFIKALFVNRRS